MSAHCSICGVHESSSRIFYWMKDGNYCGACKNPFGELERLKEWSEKAYEHLHRLMPKASERRDEFEIYTLLQQFDKDFKKLSVVREG